MKNRPSTVPTIMPPSTLVPITFCAPEPAPLAIASGAGSGAQRAIGTGVLGGMIAGTALGLFFIPLFFVVVQRLFNRKRLPAEGGAES